MHDDDGRVSSFYCFIEIVVSGAFIHNSNFFVFLHVHTAYDTFSRDYVLTVS